MSLNLSLFIGEALSTQFFDTAGIRLCLAIRFVGCGAPLYRALRIVRLDMLTESLGLIIYLQNISDHPGDGGI